MMAHIPLAHLQRPANNALVICFGMGTTFRSFASWGVDVTAVELTPSVPQFFSYFYDDAPQLLANQKARVVIDDGRRFLDRTPKTYDVIVLDPPPPAEAAASGLLYSKEFYDSVKRRLAPDGILMQWLPAPEPAMNDAMAKTLHESFPYLRFFRSIEGWGVHCLASMRPLPKMSGEEMLAKMPPAAVRDLSEWYQGNPVDLFNTVLSREIFIDPTPDVLNRTPNMTDDHPFNEYFLLRRHGIISNNAPPLLH
jgi:spermidine synthase